MSLAETGQAKGSATKVRLCQHASTFAIPSGGTLQLVRDTAVSQYPEKGQHWARTRLLDLRLRRLERKDKLHANSLQCTARRSTVRGLVDWQHGAINISNQRTFLELQKLSDSQVFWGTMNDQEGTVKLVLFEMLVR